MNEPNHFRRIVVIWLIASVIATPLVVFVLCPILPPGNGLGRRPPGRSPTTPCCSASRRRSRSPCSSTSPTRWSCSASASRAATPLDGPPIRGHAQRAAVVDRRHDGDRAVPRRPTGRSGCSRTEPAAVRARTRSPSRCGEDRARPPGPGDRASSGASPTGSRPTEASRQRQLELPANTDDRVPRHLGRRDPLVLGLPARRQGRRQSGRRQRRLRADEEPDDLRRPLRRAVRRVARLHVRHRAGRPERAVRHLDRSSAGSSSPRRAKALPPYSKTYFPDPQRRGG